jgi:hypothetical protein
MATHTGKTDERFARDILQLASEGSQRPNDYGEVEACCRDAIAHAKKPPTSNGFFETSIQSRFAPGAPRIGNGDLAAAKQATRMDRRRSDPEAQREKNRRQLAELQAKADAAHPPGFSAWQEKHTL